MVAIPWPVAKAFADFGHSSGRHLLQSDYLGMVREALLVRCIGYALPTHFVASLAEGMETLSCSSVTIQETLRREKNMNHHPAGQVKASEKIHLSGG
jgi:hypothetical protein